MKALLVGSSGRIMSSVGHELVSVGWDIFGIDSGQPPTARSVPLSGFMHGRLDRASLSKMQRLSSRGRFDAVILGVGLSSVSAAEGSPQAAIDSELTAIRETLGQLSEMSSEIVYLSSAAVYGMGGDGPSYEEDPPRPVSIYGTVKARTEDLLLSAAPGLGVDLRIVRPFSIFGRNMTKQVVWEIFNQLSTTGSVVLEGNPNSRRDFVHIVDLAKLIVLIMRVPGMPSILNACSGVDVSVLELVSEVSNALSCDPGSVSFAQRARPFDPVRMLGSTYLLNSLGLPVPTPLQQALPIAISQWKADPCSIDPAES